MEREEFASGYNTATTAHTNETQLKEMLPFITSSSASSAHSASDYVDEWDAYDMSGLCPQQAPQATSEGVVEATVDLNVEDRIRKMLCPELELELLKVDSITWATYSQEDKQRGEDEARSLLESFVTKVNEAFDLKVSNERMERQAKNAIKLSCPKCKNRDQANFIEAEGSIICLGQDGTPKHSRCGYEVRDHKAHEGT